MRALCARGARCGVGAYVYAVRARDRVRSNAARRFPRRDLATRARRAAFKKRRAAETVGDAPAPRDRDRGTSGACD